MKFIKKSFLNKWILGFANSFQWKALHNGRILIKNRLEIGDDSCYYDSVFIHK